MSRYKHYWRQTQHPIRALWYVLLFGATFGVNAEKLMVTHNQVYGPGGLIEAINKANMNSDLDTIIIPAGTYTLTKKHNEPLFGDNGLPVIKSPVTILGQGAAITIIKRESTERFRNLAIGQGGTLTLQGLTVTGGQVGGPEVGEDISGGGGGIFNMGKVILVNVIVDQNLAYDRGGGIANLGAMTIFNATISRNKAISNNDSIEDSLVGGGGIINNSFNPIIIANTTIYDNEALGVNANGGGILNINSINGTLTNTTISGNKAAGKGGGIYNEGGDMTLFNATVTGNVLSNSVFYGNAILTKEGDIRLKNTIVQGNCGIGLSLGGAQFISFGYNLVDRLDASGAGGCGTYRELHDLGGDPLLGSLQDNGGQTHTHALLAGSPAIDAGDNFDCPASDQRHVVRPQAGKDNSAAACDIGAFEVGKVGDLDLDGDVDLTDIKIIRDGLGNAIGYDDPRDIDGDRQITVLDARKLVLLCSKPRCEP